MNTDSNQSSNNRLLTGKLSRLLAIIVLGASVSAFQGGFSSGNNNGSTEGRGWRVWIRTEPCPGRFDWLSVAKEKPGGGSGAGLGTFWLYDSFLPRLGCTEAEPFGCTFAEAESLMESLRPHPKFFDFCCREYSVWKNNQTGEKSIVGGKFGTAGHDFTFERGDLCCEEAEALAGIPGACSGGTHAPPLGPTVRRTPGNTNTTVTPGAVDGADDFEGTVWLIPGEFATLSIFKVKPDKTVEAGEMGDDKIRWTGTYQNKRLKLENPYYAGSAEYERLEATVNGSTMTGFHRYKVYTDQSDEPFTGYCINCWVNWTMFGLIGAGGIALIVGGIWLRRMKRRVKPAGEKPAPAKKTAAEKKPDTAAPAKKLGLSRRCSRCSQIVRAGNTSCPACGTSL